MPFFSQQTVKFHPDFFIRNAGTLGRFIICQISEMNQQSEHIIIGIEGLEVIVEAAHINLYMLSRNQLYDSFLQLAVGVADFNINIIQQILSSI